MDKRHVIEFVDNKMRDINMQRGHDTIPKIAYHDMFREYFSRLASELRTNGFALLKSYKLKPYHEKLINDLASFF